MAVLDRGVKAEALPFFRHVCRRGTKHKPFGAHGVEGDLDEGVVAHGLEREDQTGAEGGVGHLVADFVVRQGGLGGGRGRPRGGDGGGRGGAMSLFKDALGLMIVVKAILPEGPGPEKLSLCWRVTPLSQSSSGSRWSRFSRPLRSTNSGGISLTNREGWLQVV